MSAAKQITMAMIYSWGPCYGNEKLAAMAIRWAKDHPDSPSPADPLSLCDWEVLPAKDRLWLLLREEIIPGHLLHELACRFAEHVLPTWERMHPQDTRPHEAIAAKRAWMRGEITDEQLAAARYNAWEAAKMAAQSCCCNFAVAVAVSASTIPRDAAMHASTDSAGRSAHGIKKSSEQQWQLGQVREVLVSMAQEPKP